MEKRFRDAQASDFEDLVSLAKRTIDACYTAFLGNEPVMAYLRSGRVEEYLEEHLPHCCVLVEGERICAFAAVTDNRIDLLMVDPEFQRHGLGTAMLRHIEAALFLTHDVLVHDTFRDNAPAIEFYQRNGWHLSGDYENGKSQFPKVQLRKVRDRE